MITFKNVGFKYDEEVILNDINIVINKGRYVTILGSNGSGKSTINKLISKMEEASSGEVIYEGVTKKDVKLVFQNPDNQFVKSKVFEELSFGLENEGLTKNEIINRINEISKEFDITHLHDKNTYELSGGQKQIIMLVSILLSNPKVLILDEALEMIDEKTKQKILDYLIKLKHNSEFTIVMVTHKMNDAVLSDDVYVINNKTVEIAGSPEYVFSNVDTIKNARLEIPLSYLLSKYTNCNYEIVRDLKRFKEYYDTSK